MSMETSPRLTRGLRMVKGAWSIKPLASNSEVKELSILERRNSYVSFKNKMREHWDNMWAHDLEGDFPELVPLQPLAKLLSPMLLSMSVCGLFHLTDEIIADDPKHRFKYRIAFIMGKAMSFLMLVFCWVIVAINAYHFPYEEFSFNHKVFSYIVYVAWFFQNAISVTCCFVACFRKKLYRKLFKKWADICFPENIAKQINRYCVVIQWSFVVICWMSIVIVVAVFVQIFFLRRDLQDDEFEEMVEQSGEIDTYGVLAILSIPVWTFSLGPLTLFCLVLRYVFEKNTAIMRCIFKSERPFLNIEDHRQRHESICETLEVADNIFSFTIFSFFANYLLLLCLIAFELVALDSGHDMKLIRFFWCLISISTITIICFAAASVNSAAQKLLKYLHSLPLKLQSKQMQLILYVLRFNGSSLGFTAWRMFTITRSTILSMTSLFMTYLLLLVQLQPESEKCSVAISSLQQFPQTLNSTPKV